MGTHVMENGITDKLTIGPETDITFLSSGYRFVFALDLSCSALRVDTFQQCVLSEMLLTNLEECLVSLIQPFFVPGIASSLMPVIFVTVFAQWTFSSHAEEQNGAEQVSQEVIIQGCRLTMDSIKEILQRVKIIIYSTAYSVPEKATCLPKHDDMLLTLIKTGLLALKLLPSNTSSGIVVLTDGVVGEPEPAALDRLMSKCQNATIACSFIHINPSSFPLCSFGCVSHHELMEFIAHSTKGNYINTFNIPQRCHEHMNFYQHVLLKWSFQARTKLPSTLLLNDLIKEQPSISRTCSEFEIRNLTLGCGQAPTFLSRKHSEKVLRVSLLTIVSSRLREGYEITKIVATRNSVEVHLLLSWWKNGTAVEYRVSSPWPVSKNTSKVEVHITGMYAFLLDVSRRNPSDRWTKSRKLVLHRFFLFLQDLQHADHMLQYLVSFNADRVRYVVSDAVAQAQSLFFHPTGSTQYVLSKQAERTSSTFSSYWKPVLSLDINIWQRWLHIHQIHAILCNTEPLPKHLHALSSDGRYHSLQFQVAFSHLTSMLREWSTFVLLEGHTYVKFIYLGDSAEKPSHFFLLRLSNKFPCVVIKLAFLIGVPGQTRKQYVGELQEKVSTLGLSSGGKRVRHSSSRISPQVRHHHASDKKPSVLIIKKPVDQILICHQQVPKDFFDVGLSSDIQFNPMKPLRENAGRLRDMAWYLTHKRYIWSLTNNTVTPLSMKMASSLPTLLLKLRLAEGFCIAHSAPGVVNLIKEFPVSSMFSISDGYSPADVSQYGCLVQCIVFPPMVRASESSSNNNGSEWDEDDHELNLKSPKEILLAVEVWTEPQNGYVYQSSQTLSSTGSSSSYKHVVADESTEVPYYEGLDHSNIGPTMIANDSNCISNVITLEHLQLMCSSESVDNIFPQSLETFTALSKASPHDISTFQETLNSSSKCCSFEKPIVQHSTCFLQHVEMSDDVVFYPCVFDLQNLLEQSSKVKLLFLTLAQESKSEDGPNCSFFKSYHQSLEKLSDCEVSLSKRDQQNITEHIIKNKSARLNGMSDSTGNFCAAPPLPTANWSCYLKQGDDGQIFVIFLPSSYKDFLSCYGGVEDTSGNDNASSETSACSSGTVLDQAVVENPHAFSSSSVKTTSVPLSDEKLHDQGSYHRLGRRISFKRLTSVNDDKDRTQHAQFSLHQRTLPVFIYNCSMQMLVSSALQSVNNPTRMKWQDSFQDHRFISYEAVDDASGEAYQTFSPTKDVFDSFKFFGSGDREASDRDDVFPLTSKETSKLQHMCNAVVQAYYRSFVKGVYAGVQDSEHVQALTDDLQIAADIICHESIDELDITDFMLLHSPQVIEFRSQNFFPHSFGNLDSVEQSINMASDCQMVDIVDTCQRRDSAEKLSSIHSDAEVATYTQAQESANSSLQDHVTGDANVTNEESVADKNGGDAASSKVSISLHKDSAFTTVRQRYRDSECERAMSDCSSSDDSTDNRHRKTLYTKPRERRVTQTMPVKQINCRKANSVCVQGGWDNLPEFPLALLGKQQLRHFSGSNEQLSKYFCVSLKRYCKRITTVPDLYYCFPFIVPEMKSATNTPGDVGSDTDSVLFDCVSNKPVQDESETPEKYPNRTSPDKSAHSEDDELSTSSETSLEINPLFLCMTCTVRDKKTGNQGTLPVNGLPMDLAAVLNSFENHCSSVDLSQLKITLDLIWLFLPSVEQGDKIKMGDNCDGCEVPEISELPPDCLSCAEGIRNCIAWLVEDEIVSSLRTCEQVNADTLKRVTAHIEKTKARNCRVESVPLHFIFGTESSKSLFTEEFERLRLKRYKLKKENDYYYLSLESTSFLPIACDDRKSVTEDNSATLPTDFEIQHIDSDERKKQSACSSPAREPVPETNSKSTSGLRHGRQSCISLYHREYDTSADCIHKAASSTELRSGSGIGKRSNSISYMCSEAATNYGKGNKENLSKGRPSPLHSVSGNHTTEAILSPAGFHPPLQNSLSCGRDPYSSLTLNKDCTASMPATPVNFSAGDNTSTFCFPPSKIEPDSVHRHSNAFARDLIASPLSDNSPRNLSQTSWLASGYEGEVSDTEDEDCYLQSIQDASSRLPSFWLIVLLKDDCANVYFHRRGSARVLKAAKKDHDFVFQEIRGNLLSACRSVNQTLLLKKLHESRLCHSLLVEEPVEEIWRRDDLSIVYQPALGSDEYGVGEDMREKTDYLAAKLNFRPGHFECNCVLQQHIALHHRIAGASSSTSLSNACPSALATVRSFLKNFAVVKQRNMFVFQMEDGAIYYCRMHAESRKSEPSSRRTSLLPPGAALDQVSSCLRESKESVHSYTDGEPKLHLCWYGVHKPTLPHKAEIKKVEESIKRKLDEAVLEYITVMLTRNQMFKLTPADVLLIQPRECRDFYALPKTPDESFLFSVPFAAVNEATLPAFLFYLHQNLLQVAVVPRYTEPSKLSGYFLSYHATDKNDAAQSLGRFPGKAASTPSSIYLYISSKDKGRIGQGIGCIFLDVSCAKEVKYPTDVSQLRDYSVLLEKTTVEQLPINLNGDDALENQSTAVFHVWITGFLKTDELASKFLLTLRHAVCDLFMEQLLCVELFKVSVVRKSDSMRNLFDSTNSENSSATVFTIIQARLKAGVGSRSTDSKSSDSESARRGELDEVYHDLLPALLKHMHSLGCPSVSEKEYHFNSQVCLRNSMRNFVEIFSSCFPQSHVLPFTKLRENKGWFEIPGASADVQLPGKYPAWLLVCQSISLSKKSRGSSLSVESLKHHNSSMLKFQPHDSSIKPDLSPCPQHALITSSSYIPRQHFALAVSHGSTVTVYLYNVNSDKSNTLYKELAQCCKFHNARHSMVQDITFQKLGLFQHFQINQKTSSRSSEPGSFSVDSLTKHSTVPDIGKMKQKFTFVDRHLSEMYLDFKPEDQWDADAEGCKDNATLYGLQCTAIGKQKFRMNEESLLLSGLAMKCHQPSHSVCTVSRSVMSVLMSCARLVHSESSPILFSSSARKRLTNPFGQKKLRQRPTSGSRGEKADSKSSKSSFLGSYRKKSGDSLSKLVFGKDVDDGSKISCDSQEYNVDYLAGAFYQLYLDQWRGFTLLEVDQPRSDQPQRHYSRTKYLFRLSSGCIALITCSFHPNHFQTKLYVVDLSQPGAAVGYSSKPKLHVGFTNMCENVKKALKTAPFTLNLQLHEIKLYLSGIHSTLPANTPICSILLALLESYGPILKHVSHHLLRRSVAIPCPDVLPHELFSFIVDNSAQFNLKVLERTTGLATSNRAVMCSTMPLSTQHAEGCRATNHDSKDACLVIFQGVRSAEDALMLDYYVLFTQKPVQPSLPPVESEKSRSRRFSEKPDISIVKSAVELHRQAMNLSSALSADVEDADTHDASCFVYCEQRRTESYLAKIGATAEVECYRSRLWQRLLLTSSEKAYGNALTLAEFEKLLQLMQAVDASHHDEHLAHLLSKRNRGKQGLSLLKRLLRRFAKTSSQFVSADGQRHWLCVLHPNLHCMVTVYVDTAQKDVFVNTVQPLEQSKYVYADFIPDALANLLQSVLNEVYVDFWSSWW